MPSETLHSSHLAHQPGETTTESGIVVPASRPNVRETISLEDIQRAKAEKESSTPPATESAYDRIVLGGEQAPVSAEMHTAVLEHVTSELDSQSNEIKDLHAENAALQNELAALKRQIAELKGEKFLAADQPRRVRKQNGVTERLVKYEDGSYAWDTIRVDPEVVIDEDNVNEEVDSSDIFEPEAEAESESEVEVPATPEVELTSQPSVDVVETTVPADEQQRTPGKELEPYTGEVEPIADDPGTQTEVIASEPETDDETEQTAETESQEVVAKKWWQKAGDYIRPRAGTAYWTSLWSAKYQVEVAQPIREYREGWLNRGVTEDMSKSEVEKKRKHNRYAAIAAGVGVGLVSSVIAGLFIAKGYSVNDLGVDAQPSPSPGPSPTPPEGVVEQAAMAPPVAEVAAAPAEIAYDPISVESGDGGMRLFQRLGLDSSVWNRVAPDLAAQFPQDFYVEGTDVRLMRPGQLSQQAQDYINSLR